MSEKQTIHPDETPQLLTAVESFITDLERHSDESPAVESSVSHSLKTEYEKLQNSTNPYKKAYLEYLTDEVLTELSIHLQHEVIKELNSYVNFLSTALQSLPADQLPALIEKYKTEIDKKAATIASKLVPQAIHDRLTLLTSRIDYKTQLFNINVFNSTFEAIAKAKKKTGIAFIDLDKLGPFNEALSEDVFDMLYLQFASFLKKITRDKDIVCRTGGDEIKVIFNGIEKKEDLEAACKKVSTLLKQHEFEVELTEQQVDIIRQSWAKNHKLVPTLSKPIVDGDEDTHSQVMQVLSEESIPQSNPHQPGTAVDAIEVLKAHAASKGLSINDIPKEEAGFILADAFLRSLKAFPNKRRTTEGKHIYTLKTKISASIGASLFDPSNYPEEKNTKAIMDQFNAVTSQAEKQAKETRGTFVVK